MAEDPLVRLTGALEVRQYLQTKFHLNPERLGIIPLADHPLTGKRTWDGVCLVLVVSKK